MTVKKLFFCSVGLVVLYKLQPKKPLITTKYHVWRAARQERISAQYEVEELRRKLDSWQTDRY